jgi:hypothetical protein
MKRAGSLARHYKTFSGDAHGNEGSGMRQLPAAPNANPASRENPLAFARKNFFGHVPFRVECA